MLENLVFVALRRVAREIFYFKSKNGREVDFVALDVASQGRDRTRLLVQVCDSMADPQTRKREVTALSETMSELNLSEDIIVTRNEEVQIPVEAGMILVVPVWRFLLNPTG
ncbi:hypothetical protein [Acidithiobacillus sp.]|uniref:hypothetical protein n=1 Tax=Acidithiobacillus sp. TaxID=1872118 RepID=UPI003459435C